MACLRKLRYAGRDAEILSGVGKKPKVMSSIFDFCLSRETKIPGYEKINNNVHEAGGIITIRHLRMTSGLSLRYDVFICAGEFK